MLLWYWQCTVKVFKWDLPTATSNHSGVTCASKDSNRDLPKVVNTHSCLKCKWLLSSCCRFASTCMVFAVELLLMLLRTGHYTSFELLAFKNLQIYMNKFCVYQQYLLASLRNWNKIYTFVADNNTKASYLDKTTQNVCFYTCNFRKKMSVKFIMLRLVYYFLKYMWHLINTKN